MYALVWKVVFNEEHISREVAAKEIEGFDDCCTVGRVRDGE